MTGVPHAPAGLSVTVIGGVALLLATLWAWRTRRHDAAIHALLGACLPGAVALLTGADQLAPGWIVTLHELALGLVPAGFLHFALTFPIDRLQARRTAALLFLYLPGVALALVAQMVADDPVVADGARHLTTAAVWGGGLAVFASLAIGALRGPTPLARRRGALALLGAVLPGAACLLSPSSATAGAAVDLAAPTLFLFPLAVGAALRPAGLIGLDDMLRRALSGALLAATVAATCLTTLFVVHLFDPDGVLLGSSPAIAALLILGIVFLVAPVRDAVRGLIDRGLAPATYDSEASLLALSRGLASARTVDTVIAHARTVLAGSLSPSFATIYLPDGPNHVRPAGGIGRRAVSIPAALAVAFERGEMIAIDDVDDAHELLPSPWNAVDTALLVPLRANRTVVGLLVLGRRTSRRSYTTHDLTFLRSAAYQIALALLGSAAIDLLDAANQRLADLNAGLEREVGDRTAALQAKNAELNDSLADLQRAYRRLESHQAGLLRAERLAALGRLTASLAHEINTPLSAVMNSLKVLADLGREYEAAIGDIDVLPADHREIAREIQTITVSACEWAQKAASYIRSFKSHLREADNSAALPFAVREVVDEVRRLIAHRLRNDGCRFELSEEPPGLTLIGDRAQLGQVLVNLITNAADAYEDNGIANGRIAINAARSTNGGVRLRVTDWAGGIPTLVLPHIFEELYTTKAPGRGTGLGLWIARALVEQGFGGTLDVITGRGSSCFLADFPAAVVGEVARVQRTVARLTPVTAAAAAN
jgi:signal transduction histidine kinase